MKHKQAIWTGIATLAIAAGLAISQDMASVPNASIVAAMDLTIDLPPCRDDANAWRTFSRWAHLRQRAWSLQEIAKLDQRWRKEDAVDITWVDIDGDGRCDVISSGDEEPYKHASGKPTLLLQPRGIYLRTAKGFKVFKEQFEGSSFTLYWDKRSRSAVIFKRVYQGNLVGGGSDNSDEFHLRQTLRAAFAAKRAGNAEEEGRYLDEANPFLYTDQVPKPVAKRIWTEEARRAGVNADYPYLD